MGLIRKDMREVGGGDDCADVTAIRPQWDGDELESLLADSGTAYDGLRRRTDGPLLNRRTAQQRPGPGAADETDIGQGHDDHLAVGQHPRSQVSLGKVMQALAGGA